MFIPPKWESGGKVTDFDNMPNVAVKPISGKFSHVRDTFENKKGGTTLKVLPSMYERNDLEEHLFVFLKRTSLNSFICTLNKADKFSIHEDDIVEELATPELTRRGKKYRFWVELWTQTKCTSFICLFFIFLKYVVLEDIFWN